MQSGCSLNLWTRGKPNAIEVAELMGYAERNERDIYAKLCKESQKKIANAQCRVKDVSIIKYFCYIYYFIKALISHTQFVSEKLYLPK